VAAFITDYAAIERIIYHLEVTFTCQRSPAPPHQEDLY
jgi:hypothetical protein